MTDTFERLRTALTGRYTLERELGAGGMAVVYLAHDVKHDRPVALKVVRPEMTALLGPERFLREIAITGRLHHPHILPLLESGVADGLLYYVMPFAEGESLRQRLDREKQLPLAAALRIARETADALDYAHRHGVVHRDIKPENLLLAEQHAVVADFGIARAVEAAGGEKLTKTGVAIGTPAYMSPEQCVGSRELDGRSDLYSLGCVLYEMLSGQPPFTGATAESLTYQHLCVAPRPVRELRPKVPEEIERAIMRTLAKAAADRFITGAEFAAAMEMAEEPRTNSRGPVAEEARTANLAPQAEVAEQATAGRDNGSAIRRARLLALAGTVLVVMLVSIAAWKRWGPFSHWLDGSNPAHSGKKDWILVAEFDGPAADSSVVAAARDLVMAALDQSEIVATVPRDQIRLALQSAGKPASTRVDAELARELAYRSSVRTVLEGRVGRLGKGYSLVLSLVDADSAQVVVSVSDAARDEESLIPTVGRIAKRLRMELGERRSAIQATRELGQVMTPSFEAYRSFTRGRALMLETEYRAGIAWCRRALAIDPHMAIAWGVIATCYSNLGEPDSSVAAFRQALADPERLTERTRILGPPQLAYISGDVAGALAGQALAVQLLPQIASTYDNMSVYLRDSGRFSEALESARTAEKVSAVGPSQITLLNQFNCLLYLGRLDEARLIVPKFRGRSALEAPMLIDAIAGQWSAAESLAIALRSTPSADDDLRRSASTILAAVQASRGEVRAADQTLRQAQSVAESTHERTRVNWTQWDRLRLELFSRGAVADPGSPGSWDSTTAGLVVRGAWAAATGDTTLARRLPATIRKRSAIDLAQQGYFGPDMVEAWLAARTGRWQEVLRLLGPAALQGEFQGYAQVQSAPLIRWLVAEAYERLDRPDSAAVYFERAIAPLPAGGKDIAQIRMASSFAHRRLVVLYARVGRLEDARRHWEFFSAAFTHPDAEMLPQIEEARSALASAERMAKSEGR